MSYYWYNSFELMKDRLTPVDMLNLADLILELPLQVEREIDGKQYLFAHAMMLTSNDSCDYRKIVRNLTLEKP